MTAQSAPPAGTPLPADKTQPPQKEKATPPTPVTPPAATPQAATPSRYASPDMKGYIEALASQLAIRGRASDPFGQLQDPNAKPIIKPTAAKATRRIVVEPPAALSDIVGRIDITTIMPKEKRFFVGSRSIGQGDKLPISFRNRQIHTEITEVSSRRIVFRNIDTGEIGVRQLNLMPPGITRGINIAAPGITPASPNAPLEIDSSPPSPATPSIP